LGGRCCGAPIVDAAGQVRGAISVAGPAFRLTMKRVELLGPEVAQAARRIGAQLDAAKPRAADSPVEPIDGSWAFHGAFPLWLPRQSCLLWADTLAPALHRTHGSAPPRDDCIADFDAPIFALLREPSATLVLQHEAWLRVPDGSGRLSGLALDHDGGLWPALSDGWSVVRIAPDGAIDRVVGLPVPCPTDLAFGGPRGDQLFVASARDTLSMDALGAAPLSGRLFVLDAGVAGAPAHERRVA